MDVFWQGVFGSLIIAALTGITILAYKHPAGYGKIYYPIVGAIGVAWLVWFVYGIAYTSGFGDAIVETMKLNTPKLIKTPSNGSTPWWYFFIPAALYIYLSFLRILPHLLTDEQQEDSKE